MNSAKKISYVLRYLMIYSIGYFGCTCIAFSQKQQIPDSKIEQSVSRSKTVESNTSFPESSTNFYRIDSIFSFKSQKGYFPSLLNNFGKQVAAPLKFKKKEWIILGTAIGITTSLILIDNDIDEWARVQKQKHRWVDMSSPIVTQFGGSWGIYTVAATGLINAAFKNQKGVETTLQATQAMITSGAWVHLIKILTGRERPETDYVYSKSEGGKWYGPFAMYDQDIAPKKPGSSFDSFPSGHTAMAFSIATVFASQYRDIKVIPILSYSLASLVGVSRLTEHKHWASDVFVGGLIGYACGRQVVAHYNKTHQNPSNSLPSKSKNKTEITFFQYNDQVGLSLKW